jgi:hypothetical protein
MSGVDTQRLDNTDNAISDTKPAGDFSYAAYFSPLSTQAILSS